MKIPDYIEDLLSDLPVYIKVELLRLVSGETTQTNLIQKRYRAKNTNNRIKYTNLGLVLQLYKDLLTFNEE